MTRCGPSEDDLLKVHTQVQAIMAGAKAKWPGGFVMEDPDDDASDNDDASGDDSSDDSGSEGQEGKEKDTKSDASGDDEVEKVRKRMRAADQRAAAAERELQELRDKDKPELERAQNRVKELEPALETAQSTITSLRMQVAFLSDNTYTWHDPEDALRLVDMADVDVDDDGKVTGLSAALKKLATAKPHLVKPAAKPDDDDDEEPEPSGSQRNGKRKGEAKSANREALAKKYPALRR